MSDKKTTEQKGAPTPEPSNAKLWKRLCATLYDSLILCAVSLLYFALVTFIFTAVLGSEAKDFQPNAGGLIVQLGWLISVLGFYCFFWLRVGQTVAMKAWRLKLKRADGKTLTLSTCLIRALAGFLGLAAFGLGWLWALIDKDGCCLHDRISNTRVVQLAKGS
ncbi:RDD family protein [Agaribacterium haliotis]|uniref:RDD family protein n=1 Tax=Agaribacterium haliotis TaxID=2013869 RepID=UPI000BB56D03|nr:RDD family protein [Agaribacterium haliotis]